MKLALGTVQFGLKYGVSNEVGQPTLQEVRRILELALSAGIDTVDTAHHYGESETVLGKLSKLTRGFRIITKTPILKTRSISEDDIRKLSDALQLSLNRLERDSVEGLLVHDVDDLLTNNGDRFYLWLVKMRDAGKIGKLGVSVYSPGQAVDVLDRYDFDLIQAPLNLLDQRVIETGLIERLRSIGMEIHVRSVFLQGLFFMPPAQIPEPLAKARPFVNAIQERARDIGVSVGALALGFLKRQAEIDRIVVGVDTPLQLTANIQAYATQIQEEQAFSGLACNDLGIINPSMWGLNH